MQPHFVCYHTPTVKKIAEQSRKMQPVKTITYGGLGLLFFGYMLKRNMTYGFQGLWLTLLILSGVYLLWLAAMPEITAFLSLRRITKQLGEVPSSRLEFGENIEISQGEMQMTIEYSDIRWVKQYRHTFILAMKDHMGISLDPDSFTTGDFASFKAFLREKCPDVKIPE